MWEKYISGGAISPDGKRALVNARGEVFSLPSEKRLCTKFDSKSWRSRTLPGLVTQWKIHCLLERTNPVNTKLTVRDMQEGAKEKKLTSIGPGFRYNLYWSPDSKKLTFVDQTMTIWVYDMEANSMNRVDQDVSLYEGALRNWSASLVVR